MDNPRIEKKIDQIQESIKNIEVTLAVNTASLQTHIKRTDLLEEKLEPVEKHVERINGILKFIGFIGIVAGIVKVVFEIIKGS